MKYIFALLLLISSPMHGGVNLSLNDDSDYYSKRLFLINTLLGDRKKMNSREINYLKHRSIFTHPDHKSDDFVYYMQRYNIDSGVFSNLEKSLKAKSYFDDSETLDKVVGSMVRVLKKNKFHKRYQGYPIFIFNNSVKAEESIDFLTDISYLEGRSYFLKLSPYSSKFHFILKDCKKRVVEDKKLILDYINLIRYDKNLLVKYSSDDYRVFVDDSPEILKEYVIDESDENLKLKLMINKYDEYLKIGSGDASFYKNVKDFKNSYISPSEIMYLYDDKLIMKALVDCVRSQASYDSDLPQVVLSALKLQRLLEGRSTLGKAKSILKNRISSKDIGVSQRAYYFYKNLFDDLPFWSRSI